MPFSLVVWISYFIALTKTAWLWYYVRIFHHCLNAKFELVRIGSSHTFRPEIPRGEAFETGCRFGQRALANSRNFARRSIGHRLISGDGMLTNRCYHRQRHRQYRQHQRRCRSQRRSLRGGRRCNVFPAVNVRVLWLCEQSPDGGTWSAYATGRAVENVQLAHLSAGARRRSFASGWPQDDIEQEFGAGLSQSAARRVFHSIFKGALRRETDRQTENDGQTLWSSTQGTQWAILMQFIRSIHPSTCLFQVSINASFCYIMNELNSNESIFLDLNEFQSNKSRQIHLILSFYQINELKSIYRMNEPNCY